MRAAAPRDALIVFARAPELGQVKTRLAAELGAEAALSIYRTLAQRVIGALRAPGSYSLTVSYTPERAEPLMREWLGPSVHLQPQAPGDLGERMARAISHAMSAGAEHVVVIGTDCPGLAADVVEQAFRLLSRSDVVVGPATDGGYYLIGMSRLHRTLFQAIPWSAPDTLRVTLERAHTRGLSVALLEERRDVDTAADWQAWLASEAHALDTTE